jgi:hypothetical protein
VVLMAEIRQCVGEWLDIHHIVMGEWMSNLNLTWGWMVSAPGVSGTGNRFQR